MKGYLLLTMNKAPLSKEEWYSPAVAFENRNILVLKYVLVNKWWQWV